MGNCEEVMHGLLLGVLIGLLTHHLVVWIRTPDRAMLPCLGAFALMGWYFANRLGYLAMLVGPGEGTVGGLIGGASLLVSCALQLQVARVFLQSADAMPFIDRGARACQWACMVATFGLPTLAPEVRALLVAAVVCLGAIALSSMVWQGVRNGLAGAPVAVGLACLVAVLLVAVLQQGFGAALPGLAETGLGLGLVALLAFAHAIAERCRLEGRTLDEQRCAQTRARLARNAQDERSRLLAGVVINLRQPLYAATLAAESLRRDHSRGHARSALDRLHEALETVDGLLDSMMTLAQLDAGAMQPGRDCFSLDPLLERVDNTFGPQARAKGLRWTVTPCLAHVTTDAHLLRRILFHLVSNAVTYTEAGGVLVSCRPRGSGVLLQVWDTGGGLPWAPDAQVFERHFRGESGTETDSGVGLGLAIAKRASLLLGLGLTVRSRQGHGACFSLWLPTRRGSPVEDAGVCVQDGQRLSASGAVVLDALQHQRTAMPRD